MVRLADPELAPRRRRQIMDAAIACFQKRGFHQATMQEICAEAQISPGALYRYFNSKAEIIAAIAEEKLEGHDVRFMRTAENSGLVEALCQLAQAHFEKFTEGGGGLIAEIIAESIRDQDLAHSLQGTGKQLSKMLAGAIQAAQRRGEAAATLDPDLAADTLMAAIEGIGLRHTFLRRCNPVAATSQFRLLAERYLQP